MTVGVDDLRFVVYHPALGFLVDECAGGAWSTDREQAAMHLDHAGCRAMCDAAKENGMDRDVWIQCSFLPVWIRR